MFSFAAGTFEKCKGLGQRIIIMGMMLSFIAVITSVTTAFAANPLGTILLGTVANYIVGKFMIGLRSIVC